MHQEVSFPAISLLSADLGLAHCTGFSPVAASRGRSPAVLRGLLTALASPVAVLWGTQALAAMAMGSVAPLHVGSSRIQTGVSYVGRWTFKHSRDFFFK